MTALWKNAAVLESRLPEYKAFLHNKRRMKWSCQKYLAALFAIVVESLVKIASSLEWGTVIYYNWFRNEGHCRKKESV